MGAHSAPQGATPPLPEATAKALRSMVDGIQDRLDDLAAEAFPMPKEAFDTPAEDEHIDRAYDAIYSAFYALMQNRSEPKDIL